MEFKYYEDKLVNNTDIEVTREVMREAFRDDEVTPKIYQKLCDKYFRNKPQPRNNELRDN